MVAGALGTVIVAVEDQYGNVVTSNSSNVTLSIASGNGTLGGTVTVAASSGVATFSNVTLTKSGTYTLGLTDGGLSNATTSSFTVSPAAATHLAFTTQPVNTSAGALASIAIAVEDQYNNIVTSDSSTITIASSTSVGGTLSVAAASGVATFAGLSIHAAGTFSFTASDGGLTGATSNNFTIAPAAANHLAITTAPSDMGAGNVGTVTVAVEDQYNNVVTTNSSNVTIALNGGGTLGGTLTVAAASGVATFSNLSIHTPGTFTVGVTDGILTGSTSSSFVVSPAAASQLVITTQPTTQAAGALNTIIAAVEDQYGNVVTTNSSNVTIAIGSGNGTLSGTQTVAASSGVATFAGLSITQTGAYTLTLTDGGLTAATTNSFNITPAAANHLAFVSQPVGTSAGTLGTVTVAVEDQYNNIVTTDTSTVSLTTSGTLLGTTSTAAVSGVATFNTLALHTVGTYTLTAADGSLANGTSSSFNVTPAAASQLVITQAPVSTTAGTLGTMTIAIKDQYGNVATTNNSNVTVALASGNATLGGTMTLAATNGIATFSAVTLTKAGTYSLAFTDGLLSSATSGTFTITPTAATHLALTTPPTTSVAGANLPVVVAVEDQYGNVVTGNSSNVTVALASGNATLSGTLTVAASSGVATFSTLSITKTGTYTLALTDGSLVGAVSGSFGITPAAASHLVFTQQPANSAVGTLGTVTVAVEDQYNNIVTTNSSNVTMTLGGAGAGLGSGGTALGGTLTVAAVNGVATFTGMHIHTAGTYTLSAADGALTTANSSTFTLTPDAASQVVLMAQPSNGPAGTLATFTAAVKDQYGNVITSNTSNVTATLASGDGTLTGTATVAAVNGIVTFSNLSITEAGTYTLTLTDGSLTSATTSSFTIAPAAASKLVFMTEPGNSASGTLDTVAVAVEDAFGNLVTSDTSNVTLALASGSGTLGGTVTVAASGGIATFSALSLAQAGAYTLTATDGSLTPATSDVFDVAAKLVVTVQPTTATAGTIGTITIQIQDSDNHLLAADNSPVTLSIATGPAGAAIGGTVTVNAVNGIATFSNVTLDIAGSYTLVATDGNLTTAVTKLITVTPAAASSMVFLQNASNITAGAKGTLSAQIVDQFGNHITDYKGPATLTVASGPGAITTVKAKASKGIVTFSNIVLRTAGTYTLRASAGTASALTDSFIVSPAAAKTVVFTQQPTTTTVGTIFTVVAKIADAFGNPVNNSANVTLSLASGKASLGGTLTVAAVDGFATFADISIPKAGTYSLKASAGSASAKSTRFVVTGPSGKGRHGHGRTMAH